VLQFIFGVFLVLHGLVHLLYLGQSSRRFELKPGMIWPDGSWAFSKLLGEKHTRTLASAVLTVAAIGFVASGIGLLLNQTWWWSTVTATAIFSSLTFVLLWNGKLRHLDDQGGVGVVINGVVLLAALVVPLPLP
jgi:hypothetical protein